ncbi:MAG TPA: hypothetical protein VLT88_05710 [Desulfosarcina sp.]|nr:hypothetical protein [Desulfosarcina sp.]
MQPLCNGAKSRRMLPAAILAGIVAMGCSAAIQRMHPQFAAYRQPLGVMLVLSPDIDIFEKMSDGSRIYREVLSQRARDTAQAEIVRQLQDRHFGVRTLEAGAIATVDVQSITALYRSVNRSIQLHTIGPQIFPAKKSAFDYRVGSVADMLRAYDADGMILALGHQTGIGRPDRNWLSIAVVEPQGRIIWYGIYGNHKRFDIQTPADMQALVASTMADFWESGS